MHQISREQWQTIVKAARITQRLARNIRFNPEQHWKSREFITASVKSGNEGVFVAEVENGLYALAYTLKRSLTDTRTGRSKPVVCDFCCTWQRGGNAASITFTRTDNTSVTFLCCADLLCSLHVRGLTPQATLSRSQLREDITDDERISRLRKRLATRIETIGAEPVAV